MLMLRNTFCFLVTITIKLHVQIAGYVVGTDLIKASIARITHTKRIKSKVDTNVTMSVNRSAIHSLTSISE